MCDAAFVVAQSRYEWRVGKCKWDDVGPVAGQRRSVLGRIRYHM